MPIEDVSEVKSEKRRRRSKAEIEAAKQIKAILEGLDSATALYVSAMAYRAAVDRNAARQRVLK
jgi:hypothetical protein